MQPFNQRNVIVVHGDITDPLDAGQDHRVIGGPADTILSDLSPKLSGIRDADMARVSSSIRLALQVAIALLRPGGSLLIKSFISTDLQAFTGTLRQYFPEVQRTKPEATRQGSSEFYFYAKGFAPAPKAIE